MVIWLRLPGPNVSFIALTYAPLMEFTIPNAQLILSGSMFIFLSLPSTINVPAELKMTFDARQNGGKARYVKHCKFV